VDQEVQSAVDTQRDALESFEGDWWTTDGWKALVSETTTGLDEVIQNAWEAYVSKLNIPELAGRIKDHSWVVSATELPAGVQVAFERTYITPLRELQQWYETFDEAISSLSSDNEDILLSVSDDFAGMDTITEAIECDVEELETRLDQLSEIVGDRAPSEVDQIGVLPDDRQTVDKRLERLVEERKLDIETTDSGVIIR
jgi:hypothetical protein